MIRLQAKRKLNKLFSSLGTTLIVVSLSGFLFIFYPVFRMYLFPPTLSAEAQEETGFSISIQRISAHAPIIKNVDPFDESIYKAALKRGVAHASTSALPDTDGTIFLFAHSSALPWELTRFNTVFLRLPELQRDDNIEVTYNGKKRIYKVTGKKEVWPHEVRYLSDQKHKLILQTCTPPGTALKRLLIFAD